MNKFKQIKNNEKVTHVRICVIENMKNIMIIRLRRGHTAKAVVKMDTRRSKEFSEKSQACIGLAKLMDRQKTSETHLKLGRSFSSKLVAKKMELLS